MTFTVSGRAERGFTMVEMAVVCAMVAILSVMAVPVARYALRRQDEVELRYQLRLIRNSLDKFKQYCDAGLLPQPGAPLQERRAQRRAPKT